MPLRALSGFILVLILLCPPLLLAQQPPLGRPDPRPDAQPAQIAVPPPAPSEFQGQPVREIQFENGTRPTNGEEQHLKQLLAIQVGDAFRADKVRQSIERLYATGRFYDIQVDAKPAQDGLALTFITRENFFIGDVSVVGVERPPRDSELVNSTRLELGTLWTDEKRQEAIASIRRILEDNGFFEARVDTEEKIREPQIVDVRFVVQPGPRAEVVGVEVTGKPVFLPEKVVKESGLDLGDDMTADRLSDAVRRLRKYYQKKEYLEADVGIAERRYVPEKNGVVIVLRADAGRRVRVNVEGAKLSGGRRRQLIPVYEEGTVDADLVREGEANVRNFYQSQGYFQAEVDAHLHESPDKGQVTVEYHVKRGDRHSVEKIEIRGNKYFREPLLRERMFLAEETLLTRGRYSPQYLERDMEAIKNLYRSNGFHDVEVRAEVIDNFQGKRGDLGIVLNIEEGPQTLVGKLTVEGSREIPEPELRGLLASTEGQPFSEFNVLQDRDAVLTNYYNRGFLDANFVSEARPAGEPNRVNLTYRLNEGQRVYVDRVLIGGLNHTQRHIVDQRIQVREGQPLSLADMVESQRNLYEMGVFQKADTAVQNREGNEPRKNVMFQMDEARRYTFTIGGGADIARFGGDTESLNSPGGETGFSPRVSFDVTRLNFRGLNHTVAFKSRFSTLTQRALLSYEAPRVWNVRNLTLVFNAFFERTFDVLTFRSQRLEGSVGLQQKWSLSDTAVLRYSYRRVKADRDTLRVSINLIPLFARPVRVGMTTFTFVRDRRDDPIDSTRGVFFTFDGGLSARQFGSETGFWRTTTQFASYHRLRPNLVLARNTQFGVADPYGRGRQVPIVDDEGNPINDPEGNPVLTRVLDIPLPERYFSGGGNSHRGFGVNQAGPRDPVTGFPLGGEAMLLNNVELRFPLLGPNIGGALFHDMGNVFSTIGGVGFRIKQRNEKDFDYMVHAVGFGVRYKTPIGPVRLDLAYSLNPPTFFGLEGTRQEAIEGRGERRLRSLSKFQFFFSIGQTF